MFCAEHCFYLPNETHPREDYLSHRRSAAFPAVRNFFRLFLLSCKHPTRKRERCVRFVRGRVFGFETGGAGPFPLSLPVASPIGRPAMWRARWLRFRACCSRNRGLPQSRSELGRETRRVREGEKAVFVVTGGIHPEGIPPRVAQWDIAREFERKRAREKAA